MTRKIVKLIAQEENRRQAEQRILKIVNDGFRNNVDVPQPDVEQMLRDQFHYQHSMAYKIIDSLNKKGLIIIDQRKGINYLEPSQVIPYPFKVAMAIISGTIIIAMVIDFFILHIDTGTYVYTYGNGGPVYPLNFISIITALIVSCFVFFMAFLWHLQTKKYIKLSQ